MASMMQKNNIQKEDDDEDLEALRLAALMTLNKKQLTSSNPPPTNVIFQPHMGNPNLIAIIPEGMPPPSHNQVHKQPMRHHFFRHPPRKQSFRPTNNINNVGSFRPTNNINNVGSTLKVLPQVQLEDKATVAPPVKGKVADDAEEVSTKFSRFEDTESESEDESDHEKKESDSSEEENDDVLALEDDDDSLEALMAQMEHEIGIDPDPNKKKKNKGSKCKDKETKCKESDKVKCDTKTAIVEPTIKDSDDVRIVKFEENKPSQPPSPIPERPKSPVSNEPLSSHCEVENSIRALSPKHKSPVRRSKSPIRQKSLSPLNSARERTPILRIVTRSGSPVKQRVVSPRRSPIRPKSPVLRPLSPVRHNSPRRSPARISPDRYYSANKSPSPYYRTRDKDYTSRNRSRSPMKRRSLSPRKYQRDSSPKYYRKQSLSPRSPVYRPAAFSRSPSPRYRSRSPIRRRSLSPRNRKNNIKPYSQKSSTYWSPPKRRSPSASPKRPISPVRKKDYSPLRRQLSPRRELNYRRNSPSPKRKLSPQYRNYSPPLSPRHKQRSLSPRRISPKRRTPPPTAIMENRPRMDQGYRRRSRSPDQGNQRRTRSPDQGNQRRTRSPDQGIQRRIRSPDQGNQRRVKSPDQSNHRRNRSPDQGKQRRVKSPDQGNQKRIRSPDQGNQRRTKSPSLSLSPSPSRPSKDTIRRYKSPLATRKESGDNINSQKSRTKRGYSSDGGKDSKDKRKLATKAWDRDRERKYSEDNWKDKIDREPRREKQTTTKSGAREKEGKNQEDRWKDKVDREPRKEKVKRIERQRQDESKEETSNIKVSENPVFEARRKKFENTAVVAPASKKIRLATKKTSPVEEKLIEEEKIIATDEDKKIQESNDNIEDDKSVNDEIDEIDNFLNEDVLDLSAAFWSSDDDLLPKVTNKKTKVTKKDKHSTKKPVKEGEGVLLKEKGLSKASPKENPKRVAAVSPTPVVKKTAVSKRRPFTPPTSKVQQSLEQETREDRKDDGDLRAELSRRREERLTKAGSLHEKLPARLLQSAFESALGKKKSKKIEPIQKNGKETKKSKESTPPPAPKERKDGRRVLVLKRPAAVRMQSAHINVTFPKDAGSDSESSSYTSSSSDEPYTAPASAKRRLPVYMRLGTTQSKHSDNRKIKVRTRRSQV